MKPIGALQNASLLVMALTLAACGGGGGEGVASTPPPPPPPAPSGPPMPVSSPVTPKESFTAIAASTGLGPSTSPIGVLAGPDKVTVGRDASGGYTITLPIYREHTSAGDVHRIEDTKVEFSINTLFSENDESKTFRASKSATDNSINELIIHKTGSNIGKVGLQYVNFGEFFECGIYCGSEIFNDTRAFFVFGNETPTNDIPLSGSASYAGNLAAHLQHQYPLVGDVNFSVNFVSRNVSGAFTNMTYVFADVGGASDVSVPDLGLSGKIDAGGTLSGVLTTNDDSPVQAGEWKAAFFGPGAKEIGGAFLIDHAPGWRITPIDGVFGLQKN